MSRAHFPKARRKSKLAIGIIVLASISLCLPRAGVAASCPAGTKIDYLAPLRGLPPIRRLPADGRLPFAPHHLSVRPPADLIAGGGRAGIVFESADPPRPYRLDWTVTFTVKRVDASGTPHGTLGKRTLRFRSRRLWSEAIHFSIAVPNRPGFYRSDLTIDRPHHPPTTFSQYTRVVPYRVDVVLRLNRTSYLPGETVAARLENHGTVWITYGLGLSLEGWDGMRWVPIGEGSFFPPIGISIGPGSLSDCQGLLLPADLQSGNYRLTKTLAMFRKDLPVRAYFEVP